MILYSTQMLGVWALVSRVGWLGDAMLLGKLPVPGRPANLE